MWVLFFLQVAWRVIVLEHSNPQEVAGFAVALLLSLGLRYCSSLCYMDVCMRVCVCMCESVGVCVCV